MVLIIGKFSGFTPSGLTRAEFQQTDLFRTNDGYENSMRVKPSDLGHLDWNSNFLSFSSTWQLFTEVEKSTSEIAHFQ